MNQSKSYRSTKYVVYLVICIQLISCASPRVWVQSRTETGGVIGYQNYDPATDNAKRIKALIPCANFRNVWNGLKSTSSGNATYMHTQVAGSVWSTPVDSGIVQWVELHYECSYDNLSTSGNQNNSTFKSEQECMFRSYCERYYKGTELNACIIKMCF